MIDEKMKQVPNPIAPTGLLCELANCSEGIEIHTPHPKFCWIVNSSFNSDFQSAYQLLVASESAALNRNEGNLWDTGKIESGRSLHVEYQGKSLASEKHYYWKLRTWDSLDRDSPWSEEQCLTIGKYSKDHSTVRLSLTKKEIKPKKITKKGEGHYFIDFGKAAFGTIKILLSCDDKEQTIQIHLGEALKSSNTIDRNPQGSIRYRHIILPLNQGSHLYTVKIPSVERNTCANSILMPEEIGEVMPFRYCEIIDAPGQLEPSHINQIMVHYPFDDMTSSFISSNHILNDVWSLCKHTLKATTFCGIYVDGDRERTPYEADAFINQLSYYCVDREFTLPRLSHEYLLTHSTWITEWNMHSVLMAWADYEQTGNTDSLSRYYEILKVKTLQALSRDDGLISTKTGLVNHRFIESLNSMEPDLMLEDIVDWPSAEYSNGKYGERDNYDMTEVNTVVNAFHYYVLTLMNRIAAVLGNTQDEEYFQKCALQIKHTINNILFDKKRGIYIDGEASLHASLHANMFALVFGIVPAKHINSVISFIKSKGMACSVYGAQYLLEALYLNGEEEYALNLMTAEHDRSWWNMIKVGSTMTLEAWDWKYKNNLTWNHAWGTVPANIIPRYVMGVRPVEPGFGKILIQPQPGGLRFAELRMPTIRGIVDACFNYDEKEYLTLDIQLPVNTSAHVILPLLKSPDYQVLVDGVHKENEENVNYVSFDDIGSGHHTFKQIPV